MTVKLVGAILIVLGCGGFGLSLARSHIREELALKRLISALDLMQCSLQYKLTPLPDLCRLAAKDTGGEIGTVFLRLAEELELQLSPDVQSCMKQVLSTANGLPAFATKGLRRLGQSLGRFDLEGQIKGLETVRQECRRELESLNKDRDIRIRNYQTLGLCAGAAIAILLI